jgi:hypothetical protein
MALMIAGLEQTAGAQFACTAGWYLLDFCQESLGTEAVLTGFDQDTAGYHVERYTTNSSRIHYAIFRGASFPQEAGSSPIDEGLKNAAFWNDCLLVSFDPGNRQWQVLCNRAASIPAFWLSRNGRTLVSNNMSWLGGMSGPVDRIAFAETLLWDVPLRERTFREKIRQLPAGYSLVISDRGATVRGSCLLNIRPGGAVDSTASYDDLARRAALLTSRAVERAVAPDRRLVLPISGGLDSRAILGGLPRGAVDRCIALSFGQPGALELSIGKTIADLRGAAWKGYELTDGHYTSVLASTMRDGCGMTPLQHLHLFSALSHFALMPSQLLIGFMGDPITGADAGERSGAADGAHAATAMFRKAGLTILTATHWFGRETVDAMVSDLEWLFRDATSLNPLEAFYEYYFIVERQSKLITHIFNYLHWRGHSLGFPFMDGDWARFYLSLPPLWRANRCLSKRALIWQSPDLAQIVSTADFAPVTAPPILRALLKYASRTWSRATTLSQRASGYRYSLPNPFATEQQGVVLRRALKPRLDAAVKDLLDAGVLSDVLADKLRNGSSLTKPWMGFRAITAADCLEERTT